MNTLVALVQRADRSDPTVLTLAGLLLCADGVLGGLALRDDDWLTLALALLAAALFAGTALQRLLQRRAIGRRRSHRSHRAGRIRCAVRGAHAHIALPVSVDEEVSV